MTLVELVAVRHGESVANAAFAAADAAGLVDADVTGPDSAVDLTPRGRAQAAALGRWLAEREEPVDLIVASPYRRATETVRLAVEELGRPPTVEVDERLRDREMGDLTLMTAAGIHHHRPVEAEERARVGEAEYRPPGGESMMDVAARVGAFLDEAHRRYDGRRLLVVGHDSTVLMLRHAIEGLTVARALTTGPVLHATPYHWTWPAVVT